MISIGAFTMTITTLNSRHDHMREKMAQSGREFMWSNAENPLLLTPEEREAMARSAVVGGSSGSATDLYATCVAAADAGERVDIFSKLLNLDVKPYSKHFTQ